MNYYDMIEKDTKEDRRSGSCTQNNNRIRTY